MSQIAGWDLPYDSNDAPADVWRPFEVKNFMKPLLVLFLSQPLQTEVKDAVKEDYNQDQRVTIVLSLIDGYNETEAFHHE